MAVSDRAQASFDRAQAAYDAQLPPEGEEELLACGCPADIELDEGHQEGCEATVCPHGCGQLDWVDTQYYCPKCGDEFDADMFRKKA